MAILSKKHLIPLFIGLLIALSFFWWVILDYPLPDSLIMSFFLSAIIPSILVIYDEFKKKDKKDISLWIIGFVGAMIALQAAWPLFMPRISVEDISQDSGLFFGDITDGSQSQLVREAIIKVNPPLFPLFHRSYPIDENFRLLSTTRRLNLQIDKSDDERSVQVKLGPVTGWSFDEITGKITYRSNKDFNILINSQNISNIRDIDGRRDKGLFPYDYKYESTMIENPNKFPVLLVNLTFLIEKNTSAWNSLKKWVDNGFCILPLYSENWNSSSTYRMYSNGKFEDISNDMFNSSVVILKAPYTNLAPEERKEPYIIFEETTCDREKMSSPRVPYLISGNIKMSKEIQDYLIVLVKNVNAGKTDFVISRDNTYQYDLANLPTGYSSNDTIQISVCRNAQDCITSKIITVNIAQGIDEVNFAI